MAEETEKLRRSWDRYSAEELRDYLVASVEDPRLNVQSILTRHYLLELMFGDRFAELQQHEIRFGLALNWFLNRFEHPIIEEDLLAIKHALDHGLPDAEGEPIPGFLTTLYRSLPCPANGVTVPNYIAPLLNPELLAMIPVKLTEPVLATFSQLWQPLLSNEHPPKQSVLEPACGSANDYRFMEAYGMAGLMNYTGFDLCEKNVTNAWAMHPQANFLSGNVLTIPAEARAYDVVVVHDLFEHLSIPAMELAVREVCRVARQALCLNFFQMHEGAEHKVQPVDDYHWNKLSLAKMRALLEAEGFHTQAVHIGTYLAAAFDCEQTHNPDAYTVHAWRPV